MTSDQEYFALLLKGINRMFFGGTSSTRVQTRYPVMIFERTHVEGLFVRINIQPRQRVSRDDEQGQDYDINATLHEAGESELAYHTKFFMRLSVNAQKGHVHLTSLHAFLQFEQCEPNDCLVLAMENQISIESGISPAPAIPYCKPSAWRRRGWAMMEHLDTASRQKLMVSINVIVSPLLHQPDPFTTRTVRLLSDFMYEEGRNCEKPTFR